MIHKAPKDRQNEELGLPYVDPKDYVFSEEEIEALTELALLVHKIQAEQKEERLSAKPDTYGKKHPDRNQDPA